MSPTAKIATAVTGGLTAILYIIYLTLQIISMSYDVADKAQRQSPSTAAPSPLPPATTGSITKKPKPKPPPEEPLLLDRLFGK